MTQDKLELLQDLLGDFKADHTDIDDNDYWSVEEVEGLVQSVINDNKQ